MCRWQDAVSFRCLFPWRTVAGAVPARTVFHPSRTLFEEDFAVAKKKAAKKVAKKAVKKATKKAAKK